MSTGSYSNTFRPLKNVRLLTELHEQLLNRPAFATGMAAFSGPSGFGKTFATTFVALDYDAVHIECKSFWTAKTLLEKTVAECGLRPAKTITALYDQLCQHLNATRQSVLFDDAHLLVKRGLPRIARHIHDETDVPVLLIGEEELPHDLAAFEDVVGRIGTFWRQAAPASAADIAALAEVFTPDVTLTPEMQAAILEACQGALRTVASLLHTIATHAAAHRLTTVSPRDLEIGKAGQRIAPPGPRGPQELGQTAPAKRSRAA